jgi:hypothetical protein
VGRKLGAVRLWVFGVAVLSSALLVPGALGATRGAAHPNTTVPEVFLPVYVTITDSRISLNRKTAHRGDEVRFTIRNIGKSVHTFSLGDKKHSLGRQVGFSATLKPKEEKIFLLYLDYRGTLPYRSAVKADLRKPGMRGTFKIL